MILSIWMDGWTLPGFVQTQSLHPLLEASMDTGKRKNNPCAFIWLYVSLLFTRLSFQEINQQIKIFTCMSLEKLYKNCINKLWGSWHVHVVYLHLNTSHVNLCTYMYIVYMYIQTCKSENSSFKVFLVALLKVSVHCKLHGTIVKTASISCLLSRTRNHCLFIRLPTKCSKSPCQVKCS